LTSGALIAVALVFGGASLWLGGAALGACGIAAGVGAALVERRRTHELTLRVRRLRQRHGRQRAELWSTIAGLRRQVIDLQEVQERRVADARAWAALFATVTGMADVGPAIAAARPYVPQANLPATQELAAVDLPVTQWENLGHPEQQWEYARHPEEQWVRVRQREEQWEYVVHPEHRPLAAAPAPEVVEPRDRSEVPVVDLGAVTR
jgi:hypothetical protein